MPSHSHRSPGSFEQVCIELADRLRARRAEIDQAIFARVYAIADPTEIDDLEYQHGFHAAVEAAISYALAAIATGEEFAPPIPVALLSQARLAARNAVDVGIALRRCAAGWTVLDAYLLEEAGLDSRLSGAAVTRIMSSQFALRDRLLEAVDEEYTRESRDRHLSSDALRVKRVKRLLAGELLEISNLSYDFKIHHLGVIAEGDEALQALGQLAKALNGRLLLVRPDSDTVWAWIGFRHEVNRHELSHLIASNWPTQTPLALGEPGHGLTGWRLTHRQAGQAFPMARRRACIIRYVDIALPAAISRDILLSSSLRELYLSPLAFDRDDGGTALRNTLRAYFAADRNAASAASALQISRQTVANHIKAVEKRLGRSLRACALEVEVALRVEDIDRAL